MTNFDIGFRIMLLLFAMIGCALGGQRGTTFAGALIFLGSIAAILMMR